MAHSALRHCRADLSRGDSLVAAGEGGLTYVGHATVLAEMADARILTDPVLGAGIFHVRRQGPAPVIEDLEPVTTILISHAHRDHLDHQSLRLLSSDCPLIVPRGCGATASSGAARKVIELAEGERVLDRRDHRRSRARRTRRASQPVRPSKSPPWVTCSRDPSASISPAIPIFSTEWQISPAGWTWRCSR